jgi:hypothetical protein
MEIEHTTEKFLCPSSKCKDGAELIGIVKEDGHVDMLRKPMQVDQHFVDIASQGRRPESRFRFSNKCIKCGCAQWTGSRCGIIDKILDNVQDPPQQGSLPECAIRPNCRWFNQQGANACKICPFVITDVTELIS